MAKEPRAQKDDDEQVRSWRQLTVEQVEKAIRAKAGNISAAARELKCSRSTIYRKIEEHESLKELVVDTREELVDIAESMLRKNILNGKEASIIFALKTQGKSRGYVERQEYAGVPDQPVTIRLRYDDTQDDDE